MIRKAKKYMKDREYKERITDFHRIEEGDLYPLYPLKGLHIELSNICNHQCLFCANRKMTRKKGYIDEEFLKRILNEAHDEGFTDVGFYANGEPFVSKNLPEYIKWAKEIGYSYVYIDTNGGMVEFDRIKETIDVGLDSIKFSINGTNPDNYKLIHGKDDFDRVLDNLKRTYEYKQKIDRKLNVFVSIAVTKFIENSVESFVDELKKYADDVVCNSVIEMGGYIPEELELLKTSTSNDFTSGMTIPCYLLWNSLFITYEGYATACCADFQNYFVYADLNKTSIKAAWHNDKITQLRQKHLNNNISELPCMQCAYGVSLPWIPIMDEYATICDDKIRHGYDIRDRIKAYEQMINK